MVILSFWWRRRRRRRTFWSRLLSRHWRVTTQSFSSHPLQFAQWTHPFSNEKNWWKRGFFDSKEEFTRKHFLNNFGKPLAFFIRYVGFVRWQVTPCKIGKKIGSDYCAARKQSVQLIVNCYSCFLGSNDSHKKGLNDLPVQNCSFMEKRHSFFSFNAFLERRWLFWKCKKKGKVFSGNFIEKSN